jgi:hypothetical protein
VACGAMMVRGCRRPPGWIGPGACCRCIGQRRCTPVWPPITSLGPARSPLPTSPPPRLPTPPPPPTPPPHPTSPPPHLPTSPPPSSF